MTIKGDLQAIIQGKTGADWAVAEAVTAEIFDALTSADFIRFLDAGGADTVEFCDCIEALRWKCLVEQLGAK